MVYGFGSAFGPKSETSVFSLAVVSNADLKRFVENLKKQVRILRLENEVLEASIMRLQPSLMTGAYSALEYAKRHSQTTLTTESKSRSKFTLTDSAPSSSNLKSHSKVFNRKLEPSFKSSSIKMSRSLISAPGPKINVEERLELVYAVMANQGKEIKKCSSIAMKQKAYVKAQEEEMDIRITNFEKWTKEFKQEVTIDGVDPITKRIPAEIWIRFMTEQSKIMDRQLDKLRMKMTSANVRHRTLRKDLKRKKDLVSRLVAVDIEIKHIQINKAKEILEHKTKEMIKLKATTGDTNLNLTIHRDDLMTSLKYLKQLKDLKTLRESQTIKLDTERNKLVEHVKVLEERLDWIQEQRRSYLVPDVLDYLKVKMFERELNISIRRLETRLSIKLCALRSIKKQAIVNAKKLERIKKLTLTAVPCNASNICPLTVTQLIPPENACSTCGLLPRHIGLQQVRFRPKRVDATLETAS